MCIRDSATAANSSTRCFSLVVSALITAINVVYFHNASGIVSLFIFYITDNSFICSPIGIAWPTKSYVPFPILFCPGAGDMLGLGIQSLVRVWFMTLVWVVRLLMIWDLWLRKCIPLTLGDFYIVVSFILLLLLWTFPSIKFLNFIFFLVFNLLWSKTVFWTCETLGWYMPICLLAFNFQTSVWIEAYWVLAGFKTFSPWGWVI